jgi:hypothetical protein
MSKRPRPNLTTYMEALGQEFDIEPGSIKKVGFQNGVGSVDVTITVDRSVDPFGSLVAVRSHRQKLRRARGHHHSAPQS